MTVPSGWQTLPLGELVDVLDSKRIPLSASERKHREGSVPYYGATGQVGTIDKPLFDEPLILLGEDGVQFFDPYKHKAYKISGPSWVNNHAHVLRPKPALIEFGFLLHYLNAFDYQGYANGTTRLKLTQRAMNSIPVHLPPLGEQKRIVEALDDHLSRLDKALADFAATKDNLLVLERAILHESFSSAANGSEAVDFKDFFSSVQPKFEGYKQKDYQSAGILPIVDQGSALVGGYVDEMTRRHSVQKPLIVFGDHTRCVKYVDFDFAVGADGTKILEPRENVDAKFAYWQLRGKELRNRGYARHMGELRKERFWLPNLDTQLEVSNKVGEAFDSVNHLRSQLEQQEKAVAMMRRSLLHSAFSGKMKGSKSYG
jgi:hypothetical protein